jgi:hypothetical protein
VIPQMCLVAIIVGLGVAALGVREPPARSTMPPA